MKDQKEDNQEPRRKVLEVLGGGIAVGTLSGVASAKTTAKEASDKETIQYSELSALEQRVFDKALETGQVTESAPDFPYVFINHNFVIYQDITYKLNRTNTKEDTYWLNPVPISNTEIPDGRDRIQGTALSEEALRQLKKAIDHRPLEKQSLPTDFFRHKYIQVNDVLYDTKAWTEDMTVFTISPEVKN